MFWIACALFGFIENLSKVPKISSINYIGMTLSGAGRAARR